MSSTRQQKMVLGIKTTEPMTVAFAWYKGPFQIPAAIAELAHWILEQGYNEVGPPITVYYGDPSREPPEWEVQFAIADDVTKAKLTPEALRGIKKVKPMVFAYTYHKGPYEDASPAC